MANNGVTKNFLDVSSLADTMTKLNNSFKTVPIVMDRTLKDMYNRGPGVINKAITDVFTIKKSEIKHKVYSESRRDFHYQRKTKKAGNIIVRGYTLSSLEYYFSGSKLTLPHFKTTPKKRPTKNKKYSIKSEIKKGKINKWRREGNKPAFIGTNPKTGEEIPWMRMSSKPFDIMPIKTLSLPQMVDNPVVRENIGKNLGELLHKRFNHNLEQHFKKVL